MGLRNQSFTGVVTVAFIVLAAATVAAAAPAPVAYEAVDGCPSAAAFVSAVAARDRVIVSDDAAAMRVAITKDANGFRGTLRGAPDGATSPSRELRGATCQEVADALAVVVASALAPSENAPSTLPTSVIPEPKVAVAAPSAAVSAPAPEAAPPPAPRSSVITRIPDEIIVPAGKVGVSRVLSPSIFGGVMTGPLRGVAIPRGDLQLLATPFVTTPDDRTFRTGPVVRLRVSVFGDPGKTFGTTRVKAEGFGVGLALCGPLTYDRKGLVALVCAEYSAGAVSYDVNGGGTDVRKQFTSYSTVGADFDLAYHLGDFMHIGLKAGVDATLGDVAAEHVNGARVFAPSVFGGHGLIGIGADF